MTFRLLLRRNLVIAGVVASLVVGGATIRAASIWTAAAAPLNDPPVSLNSIEDALAAEQARSAALEEQLMALTDASTQLADALEAAQGQLATDAATAEELRAALAAAQDKLAKLEASIAAARARITSTVSAPAGGGEEDHEDEDEEHEDEPDDD